MYDTIIIGTELSGLISAALLAKKGVRVAVVGNIVKPPTYVKNGYLFNERPSIITGLHGGPIGKVLDEIGISKGSFRNDVVSYQVVLPDERIDIYEGADLFHEELKRAFPGDIDRISAFYVKTSSLSGRMDEIMELNPFSFRFLLPSAISNGRKSIKGDIGKVSDRRFQSFIMSQLSAFSFLSGDLSLTAASSLIESSRKGIYSIEGENESIRTLLIRKIKTLGGDIMQTSVKDISRNGGSWLLRTEQEALSGKSIIGNMEAMTFRNLFLDGGKKYLKKAAKIEKEYYPLTINIGLKTEGIPAGMAENVVVLGNYSQDILSENLLFIQISPPSKGKRSMSITCKVSKNDCPSNERVREISENMLKRVEDLCPFIDIHTEVLDIRPPDPLLDTVYSTTLSHKMGVGLLSHEVVSREIFFAGPEVFPTLGFDGLVYSGRMAAAAALKGLEKRKA